MIAPAPVIPPLYEFVPTGNPLVPDIKRNFHQGQRDAMASYARFIALLAGTQSGKTSFLPIWLDREIEWRGPGDYLAITANFDLFKLAFLPAMQQWFEEVRKTGRYWASTRIIELKDPKTGEWLAQKADDRMWGRIILRSANTEGGLESSTALAAVLDEAGLPEYTIDKWHAIRRRLSLAQGRVLMGTTLYNFGWLKSEIYDRWVRAKEQGQSVDIDVIQFDSTMNPAFPQAEYEAARASMPLWKFNMMYRGRYDRPAGMIYDCFDPQLHTCPRFTIKPEWPRYVGLDFGGVHTAATYFAEDPDSHKEPNKRHLFLYREYMAGNRTAKDHTAALLRGEPGLPRVIGGSASEDQWRKEFAQAGLPVREPSIKEVEVGIDRVYAAIKGGLVTIFDDCEGTLNDIQSYSRKLDAMGQPLEEIENKNTFHYADSIRYLLASLSKARWQPVDYKRSPF